jgi:hypothetical protein
MLFSLDVLRARKGDCLILHYGTKTDRRIIMIDGGPSKVYKPQLKERIKQIRKARKLAAEKALPVEIVMVSHVDDDHIKGILELTRELREMKEAQQPLPLRVGSLWHNSFDDLLTTTPKELKVMAGFGLAALDGSVPVPKDEDARQFEDTAGVLASIPQGRDLRLDGKFLGWKPNRQFKGKLILAAKDTKPVPIDGGLNVTVVGPMQRELIALQKKHDQWLRDQKKKKKKDAGAALAAFSDPSIHNLSSLVFHVEAAGKTMLLTGDARGDKILEGLQLAKLLEKSAKSTTHVDVFKVPHHGSANNAKVELFKRITADHYVFSGNGEHGNPERETLEMLFEARGNAPFTMYFTYPIDEIDVERKADWEKEQAEEKARKKKTGKGTVRENWSPKKHSLAAFFAGEDLEAAGQAIEIVPDKSAFTIDLLDKLGF